MEEKVFDLEDQLREAYDKMRAREKYHKEKQTELTYHISKLQAEIRSLRTLNNDLQRDYNRILESKKNI